MTPDRHHESGTQTARKAEIRGHATSAHRV
jgi:hypothetical protein